MSLLCHQAQLPMYHSSADFILSQHNIFFCLLCFLQTTILKKKIVKSCERLKMIAKYNNTKSFISKQNGYYRLEIILLRVNKPNTICIIRRALTFLINTHVLSINKA